MLQKMMIKSLRVKICPLITVLLRKRVSLGLKFWITRKISSDVMPLGYFLDNRLTKIITQPIYSVQSLIEVARRLMPSKALLSTELKKKCMITLLYARIPVAVSL